MGSDDMLDLVVFILVLGTCLGASFNAVIPVAKETKAYYAEELEDKTSNIVFGEDMQLVDDTSMPRLEAVLMTQVQDYCMPKPRRLHGGKTELDITSLYRLDLFTYGVELNAGLRLPDLVEDSKARYEVVYNYGDAKKEDSDFFDMKRVDLP